VVTENELLAAVDAAFEITGSGHPPWPDPHPDRSPPEEQYSRLLDPAKWRILGARADAWFVALVENGLAVVERDVMVEWPDGHGTYIARTDRIVPLAPEALSIAVARSRLADLDDAGVILGVGDPPVLVLLCPDCGCDACDSGSQNDLDVLDRHLRGIVAGTFRRLDCGNRQITVIDEDGWSARGGWPPHPRDAVARILVDPTGWHEITGGSWLVPR
jgi:hypothetical protein